MELQLQPPFNLLSDFDFFVFSKTLSEIFYREWEGKEEGKDSIEND